MTPMEVQIHLEEILHYQTLEGATWLMDLDENQFSKSTNVDQLKKFYI